MKKSLRVATMLAAMVVAMILMATASFAGTADDKVTVDFKAGISGSFDCIYDGLEVTGDLVETYFPDVAEYECDGVSFADAIVAAHIKKYGAENVKSNLDMSYNAGWGAVTITKSFAHDIVGFYYQNGSSIPVVANSQAIADNDGLFAGAYADYNYADLYSFFDKDEVTVLAGTDVTLQLKCDQWGSAIDPATIAAKQVNVETGAMSDLTEATVEGNKITFKFTDEGTYYVSAAGMVTYDGYYGESTGAYSGALAKITVLSSQDFAKVANEAKDEAITYVEDSMDDILAKDQGKASVALTKAINAINNAKTMDEINAIVDDLKDKIDEFEEAKEKADAIAAAKKLKATGLKVTCKARKFTVKWAKKAAASGYQVQYRLKGKKYQTLKNIAKNSTVKAVSKKLKKGKKYQFRVRTYTTIDGKKVMGKWSAVKTVKCK